MRDFAGQLFGGNESAYASESKVPQGRGLRLANVGRFYLYFLEKINYITLVAPRSI